MKNKIIDTDPKIIIQMWLASSVWWIRLETNAKNLMGSKYADNNWVFYNEIDWIKIKKKWPDNMLLNYDAKQLKDRAERVVSSNVEISIDADGFICNDLMYRTATFLKEREKDIMHVFIHIPRTKNYLDKIELEKGKIMIPKSDVVQCIWAIIDGYSLDKELAR